MLNMREIILNTKITYSYTISDQSVRINWKSRIQHQLPVDIKLGLSIFSQGCSIETSDKKSLGRGKENVMHFKSPDIYRKYSFI